MHDLFPSINEKTVFFDLNRTISLQRESRQWISIIVTGKKVHYSRNISQPILMDPFFKVKRRIFFPRCRFLKLFKIHSNFSRFCTACFVSLSSACRTIFTCQRWKNVVFPFLLLWFCRRNRICVMWKSNRVSSGFFSRGCCAFECLAAIWMGNVSGISCFGINIVANEYFIIFIIQKSLIDFRTRLFSCERCVLWNFWKYC